MLARKGMKRKLLPAMLEKAKRTAGEKQQSLVEAAAAAMDLNEKGHTRGKIVIEVR